MNNRDQNIRVVLVDDHILFRDGLKYVLDQDEGLEVIGEASNGYELLSLLDKVEPDIILMDIAMPEMNGIEATKEAVKKIPALNIIALTMFDDEKYYYDILSAGAKGFVLKDTDGEELISAIYRIYDGESYFSNDVLVKVIRSYSNVQGNQRKEKDIKIELNQRENEVLKLICEGLTNKEIADELSLNQRTIEGIRYGLLNKTNSSNSLNLVLYAIQHRLLDKTDQLKE